MRTLRTHNGSSAIGRWLGVFESGSSFRVVGEIYGGRRYVSGRPLGFRAESGGSGYSVVEDESI